MLKSRTPSKSAGTQAPSLDDVRRQSRHRLIGAALLVVVAVIGFPMVFDTQPRRIPVDLPIHIPAQPAVAVLPAVPESPPSDVQPKPAVPAVEAAASPVKSAASANPEAAKAPASGSNKTQAAAPAPNKPEAAGQRFVVQVGAYADDARVREVRQKVERSGLKTYIHVANTTDGSRTRVRLGPYSTRAEADKVAQKVKALGFTPGILTL